MLVPLLLAAAMVYTALPRDRLPERWRSHHEDYSAKLRRVSLSQTWNMYAPNPSRGHAYMELSGVERSGEPVDFEENSDLEDGWGTTWAGRWSRRDVWRYTLVRRINTTSRNRVWFLRGLCVRADRRGQDLKEVSMARVYRRIRSPKRVRAGKATLGPAKRHRREHKTSCNVPIVREMIAFDRQRRGEAVEP